MNKGNVEIKMRSIYYVVSGSSVPLGGDARMEVAFSVGVVECDTDLDTATRGTSQLPAPPWCVQCISDPTLRCEGTFLMSPWCEHLCCRPGIIGPHTMANTELRILTPSTFSIMHYRYVQPYIYLV